MAGHGRSWPVMAGHGRSWPVMARHGPSWPVRTDHDPPAFRTLFPSSPIAWPGVFRHRRRRSAEVMDGRRFQKPRRAMDLRPDPDRRKSLFGKSTNRRPKSCPKEDFARDNRERNIPTCTDRSMPALCHDRRSWGQDRNTQPIRTARAARRPVEFDGARATTLVSMHHGLRYSSRPAATLAQR